MNKLKLEQTLFEEHDKLEFVLGEFGLDYFHYTANGMLRCSLSGSTKKDDIAIDIATESHRRLYSHNFATGYKGDIYGLLCEISGLNFNKALKKCNQLLGMEYDGYFKSSKLVSSEGGEAIVLEPKVYKPPEMYPISILDRYDDYQSIELFREGITGRTQKKFGIREYWDELGFKHVVIPHFYYKDCEAIVGIQSRLYPSVTDKSVSNLIEWGLVPKYINEIEGFKKSHNLYGFSHNFKNIAKRKQILIVESEKSVMKMDTMMNGYGFAVALGGNSLTAFQIDLLMKFAEKLGFLEVILAFDEGLDDSHLFKQAVSFEDCTEVTVSITKDTDGRLGKKDSPLDCGYKTFSHLFMTRKTFKKNGGTQNGVFN